MPSTLATAPDACRVRDAVAAAAVRLEAVGIPHSRLEAELLLAHALEADRVWVLTHARAEVPATALDRFDASLERRLGREPFQYVLGYQELWGLEFEVDPSVLIPRPETELLIETALRFARERQGSRPLRLCDVGTGSGCIAVALAKELPQARVVATDISAEALCTARRNAERHGVADRIAFARADLLAGIAASFDLIASNPPYVGLMERPSLQPELGHEPPGALFAGEDGLEVIRRLLPQAASRLGEDGCLLVEIGCGQATAVEQLAREAGLAAARVVDDLARLPRLLVARR